MTGEPITKIVADLAVYKVLALDSAQRIAQLEKEKAELKATIEEYKALKQFGNYVDAGEKAQRPSIINPEIFDVYP